MANANAYGSSGYKQQASGQGYLNNVMGQYFGQQNDLMNYLKQMNPKGNYQLGNGQPNITIVVVNPQNSGSLGYSGMGPGYSGKGFSEQLPIGSEQRGLGYEDQVMLMQDISTLIASYGASEQQAARYATDLHTVRQSGYGKDASKILKDFYGKKKKEEPDNKNFYSKLEKIAEEYKLN